jgi:hypothetical protein
MQVNHQERGRRVTGRNTLMTPKGQIMFKTERIAGFECNSIFSRDGRTRRSTCILVGSPDEPGMRAKDGAGAHAARRSIKREVMRVTGLPAKMVRIQSRYSCLVPQPDGTIARRDDSGRIIGIHMP